MKDDIRRAAFLMVSEAGAHDALALRAKRRYGWHCSDRSALARVSQWLSPSDPHQLPLDFGDALIEECVARGVQDRITPLLHRAALRAELDAEETDEMRDERRGPKRAQPPADRERRRA
jgi:hypothetical protein